MAELIHKFGIDWRLLFAQAVNFGILFFLLYRFAYHPILDVLRERREKIAEGFKMRDEAEEKLGRAGQEKESILKKAEADSLAIIGRAESLGKKKEDKIIADAMRKSEELILEGKKRAEEERRASRELFSKGAAEVVRAAAARVVEQSPEVIDEALVNKALQEANKAQ